MSAAWLRKNRDFHMEGRTTPRVVFHPESAHRTYVPIPFVSNDGGRAAAGFTGQTRDCVTRAIAIATETPYREVYNALNALAASERQSKRNPKRSAARTGVYRKTYEKYLTLLGWEFVPTMGIGTGCTVHLQPDELPGGRLIVRVSRHLTAVIDGVNHDLGPQDRDGTRCVYGYYREGESA